ncbi:hypothetical protein ASF40_03985 [Microbacterium sp. Leaf288]|uniref:hypothetical protein n=1 Tax=Microbacterium sp. Leaf288 TaxID=1736323 RepID=UPI0006F3AFDA|nr:hypothetical protein [Microbacterium sp. Leaf288]KQP70994.1 hypothetical protein ASF40_03985 [Microbacterium sp. Leaf288]
MATGADGDGADGGEAASDAALARRLQILATEHWGLLAARSTAQSEVLTRITIYLTLVSAGLVTIGLLGQATRFGSWFPAAALGILGFLSVVGLLTLMRVMTVAEEDLMYVVAMNRIRGAYADVDPTAARYFLASPSDDQLGSMVTYSFLRYRGGLEQVLGSSMILSILVNGSVGGMFVGGLCAALGTPVIAAVVVGVVVGLAIVASAVLYGGFRYRTVWTTYRPLRPSAGPPPHWARR